VGQGFGSALYLRLEESEMALTKTVNIDGKDVTFRASAYQVLPEIIELWGLNVQTQVESKKNFERLTGR
jgi:hypothetical protein